jgi:hypothetical protein
MIERARDAWRARASVCAENVMKRDWIAYVLLPAGIAGVFVGGRMASGGDPMGWIGLGVGLALAAVSYIVMRPATSPEGEAEVSREPEAVPVGEPDKPPVE